MTQRHGVATKENRFCRGVGVKRQTCRPHDKGTQAPEQPEEPLVIPDNIEDMEKLSWGQLLYLAGENAEALGIDGTGSPLPSPRHPPSRGTMVVGPGRGHGWLAGSRGPLLGSRSGGAVSGWARGSGLVCRRLAR